MKTLHAFLLTPLVSSCAPSDEERALLNASKNMAARVWTQPGVSLAINVHATQVADWKPGRDILFASINMPLGMATYGEFDQFVLVLFDRSKASGAAVVDGMRDYCRRLGRPLRQSDHGVMEPIGNAPAWGYASGHCSG